MEKKFLLEIKGGINMLYETIDRAQNGDKEAMQKLVDQFTPLMRNRANKLGYEDAYENIRLYFIELIYFMKLEKIRLKEDGGITSYINASVDNFYNKEMLKMSKDRRSGREKGAQKGSEMTTLGSSTETFKFKRHWNNTFTN